MKIVIRKYFKTKIKKCKHPVKQIIQIDTESDNESDNNNNNSNNNNNNNNSSNNSNNMQELIDYK